MGYTQAIQMRMLCSEEEALRWHLQYNLFPPVPDAFDLCMQALDAYSDEDTDRILTDGELEIRAFKVVEMLHLDAFVVARRIADDDDMLLEEDDEEDDDASA